MNSKNVFVVIFSLFFFVIPPIIGQELILSPPMFIPSTPERINRTELLFMETAELLVYQDNRVFHSVSHGGITVSPRINSSVTTGSENSKPAETSRRFRLESQLINSDGSKVSLFTLHSPQGKSEQFTLLSDITDISPRELAQIILYLEAALNGFSKQSNQISNSPILLDNLRLSDLKLRDISITPTLMPMSLTIDFQGNLIVGAISLALQFDSSFRLLGQVGEVLIDQGNYSSSYQTAVSSAGTLFLRPAMGDEIYQFLPGIVRPRRISTGISVASGIAVLRDGSLVVNDAMENRTIRWFEGAIQPFPISQGDYSTVTAFKGGPDGNLWVIDGVSGRILIFSPDGSEIDSIIPHIPQGKRSQLRNLAMYEDGSFVVIGLQGLYGFTRNGELLWEMESLPTNPPMSFTSMTAVEVDSQRGYIYLTGPQDGRVWKLADQAYRSRTGIPLDTDFELHELVQRTQTQPNSQTFQALAHYYQNSGSTILAMAAWNQALDLDPFFFEAEQQLIQLEVMDILSQANRAASRMNEALENLGVESARPWYQISLRLYEQARGRDPGNQTVQRHMGQLIETFEQAQRPGLQPNRPIDILHVHIESLFPSLLTVYQNTPVGTLTFRNTLDEPIRNVTATLGLSKFMDESSTLRGPEILEPGGDFTLPLYISLDQESLELDETIPALVRIELQYAIQGSQHSVTRSVGTTILRRTALTWDDTRKLMPFITPNDSTTARFALQLINLGTQAVSDALPPDLHGLFHSYPMLLRSLTLVHGLGSYGIRYVEDPQNPITQILGQPGHVDTVRFPRETLFYRSGDCDDTTALLASLMEAVGIQTAILTSPGHVFLAFNTKIPISLSWLLNTNELQTISHDGQLWIPLETTNLDQGFYSSWVHASGLVKTYQSSSLEFLPLSDHRNEFPPLPLPRSSFTLPMPSIQRAAQSIPGTAEKLTEALFIQTRSQLLAHIPRVFTPEARGQAQLPSERTARRTILVSLNKLGILSDLMNRESDARAYYQKALELDPNYLPTIVNFSSFKIRIGQLTEALQLIEAGLAISIESILISLKELVNSKSDGSISQQNPSPGPDQGTRASGSGTDTDRVYYLFQED